MQNLIVSVLSIVAIVLTLWVGYRLWKRGFSEFTWRDGLTVLGILVATIAIFSALQQSPSLPELSPDISTTVPISTTTAKSCDAIIKAGYTVMRNEPNMFADYSITLNQNDCINLLAITKDTEWVRVSYIASDNRTFTGWLRVASINPEILLNTLPVE